jgi:hypothetical protein
MTKLSGRRPVPFKVHVDHVDNIKGDVWAVRFRRRYLTAKQIAFIHLSILEGKPVRRKQPRVILSGVGTIWRSADKGTIVIT